jgi:hypothetical protein
MSSSDSELNVKPETARLVAGLNSELLLQNRKNVTSDKIDSHENM